MKTSFTPPHCFLSNLNKFNKVLAVLFMMYIHNSYNAQTATTFTATNAQISDTLVSGGIIRAQCIHTQDTLRASDAVIAEQNLAVQGNLNLTGNLLAPLSSTATLGSVNTLGPVIFNNTFKMSTLSGSSNRSLYVDASGNIMAKTTPIGEEPVGCFPSAAPWVIGGNFLASITNFPDMSVGTCDNFDFTLKANNIKRQWIKPDGTISFGMNLNSNTSGPEYKFHGAAMRISGANSFGGPQIIFDGTSPNGEWGIEYTTQLNTPGLNFWKPYLSPNSTNNLFFLADNGKVGIGTDILSARLTVDSWNDDGVRIKIQNANKKALYVYNAATSNDGYVMYGDGRVRVKPANSATSIEAALNPLLYIRNENINNEYKAGLVVECVGQFANGIGNYNNSGILVTTDNFAAATFNVYNANTNMQTFRINGDGKTTIGQAFATNSNYMLTVNGKIGAREIKVSIQNPWPDYVFSKSYKLMPLSSLEKYIGKNNHLPNIPSADELKNEECGLNVGEMQGLQMEKIEEIYLYLIEMDKEIKKLKEENELLKKKLNK
jgi:hypothetical protein